jgi:hypothetical protein
MLISYVVKHDSEVHSSASMGSFRAFGHMILHLLHQKQIPTDLQTDITNYHPISHFFWTKSKTNMSQECFRNFQKQQKKDNVPAY